MLLRRQKASKAVIIAPVSGDLARLADEPTGEFAGAGCHHEQLAQMPGSASRSPSPWGSRRRARPA